MDIQEQFYTAILCNDLEEVKRCHQEGADITYNYNGAVLDAAANGHLEILKWLHENGADITARNSLAVIQTDGLEILKWLHENGADITAYDNLAVINAVKCQNADEAFYLFEKGSPITGVKYRSTIEKHEAIEAEIAKFLKENNLQSSADTRSLFYAAAYSLYKHIEVDKLGEAIKERVQNTLQEIKLDPKRHAAFVPPSPTTAMEKIGFAYPKLDNAMDAVDAYVESVLLGQWLLNSGQNAEDIDEKEVIAKAKELRPIAAEILYGDRGLLGVIRYSEAWHNHPLPDDLRPLLAGQWHPLIEPHTSPDKMIIDGVEQIITITPLCSHAALKDEGDKVNPLKLAHCVGEAKYAPQCMAGKTHILSVRAGEKSLATLEIELDTNNPKKLKAPQFFGRNNQPPPEEAKQAWRWFEGELAAGRITLNPTPETGWGETEEGKRLNANPAIIKRIGYIPTPEHVAACHKHYTHGLNVKEEYIKSIRDKRSLANTRRYALEHRFVAPGGETYEKVCERML